VGRSPRLGAVGIVFSLSLPSSSLPIKVFFPPRVSPSQNPSSSENEPPTSLWKGEGRMQRVRVSEWAVVFRFEPTSLKRGEGLVAGRLGVVKGEMWRQGRK